MLQRYCAYQCHALVAPPPLPPSSPECKGRRHRGPLAGRGVGRGNQPRVMRGGGEPQISASVE